MSFQLIVNAHFVSLISKIRYLLKNARIVDSLEYMQLSHERLLTTTLFEATSDFRFHHEFRINMQLGNTAPEFFEAKGSI
jgi:hypothetical protein